MVPGLLNIRGDDDYDDFCDDVTAINPAREDHDDDNYSDDDDNDCADDDDNDCDDDDDDLTVNACRSQQSSWSSAI